MAEMYEYYRMGLDKNQVRDVNILKQGLMILFIDARIGLQPLVTNRHISMDWCTFQPFLYNWMDKWFMVFEKPPYNNMEVPLYFLRKLWAKFCLGHHVN
jgi:hypothetical protein